MANARLTAGVDLGGTKIQAVVLRGGEVVGQARVTTPQTGRPGDVIIADAVWALGGGLASAQNLLGLEAIVDGGGLGDRLDQPFIDAITGAMTPHLFAPDQPPAVRGTQLGDLSGAVGAAVMAGG